VRFLLDHDVPDDATVSLEALGHEVIKLREVLPMTTPDDEVLRLAGERGCVLITCNRDDFLSWSPRGASLITASSFSSGASLARGNGRRWCGSWIRPVSLVCAATSISHECTTRSDPARVPLSPVGVPAPRWRWSCEGLHACPHHSDGVVCGACWIGRNVLRWSACPAR
jgi:hypothetical protein